MREVVIVAGVRTPIGNFGGALKDLPPHKMGELVVREAVSRAKVDPRLIDEVIVGSVGHTSDAYNVARAIALMAGLPVRTPAYSVQRNCSSGLQPFVNAFHVALDALELLAYPAPALLPKYRVIHVVQFDVVF